MYILYASFTGFITTFVTINKIIIVLVHTLLSCILP